MNQVTFLTPFDVESAWCRSQITANQLDASFRWTPSLETHIFGFESPRALGKPCIGALTDSRLSVGMLSRLDLEDVDALGDNGARVVDDLYFRQLLITQPATHVHSSLEADHGGGYVL